MPKSKQKYCTTSEIKEEKESLKFIQRLNLQKKLLHHFVGEADCDCNKDNPVLNEYLFFEEANDNGNVDNEVNLAVNLNKKEK
ncbi:MAG: hypothetical protein CVT94_17435 [Bacteroidetes bacterium HGW-Bacteroidetes-11]|jgi:hypothetical protein|nr:MAG: hypothetical protein CVT94_17435 [Bacteroidetes bacterium HGW-Bacteroidetes-11]